MVGRHLGVSALERHGGGPAVTVRFVAYRDAIQLVILVSDIRSLGTVEGPPGSRSAVEYAFRCTADADLALASVYS